MKQDCQSRLQQRLDKRDELALPDLDEEKTLAFLGRQLSAYESISASWEIASVTDTARDLMWKEDADALHDLVQVGFHQAKALATRALVSGMDTTEAAAAVTNVHGSPGVETLISKAFEKCEKQMSETGLTTFAEMVEDQVRGLAMLERGSRV